MRWYKKILAVCSFCTLLTTANCLAVSNAEVTFSEDKNICYKTYSISEEEKYTFESTIEKEIEIEENKYIFKDYTVSGGNKGINIDIKTNKEIISKTNNKEKIIEQLGEKIKYDQDGFIGEYILDIDTIQIKTIRNGYREELKEEKIQYKDLEKNDLNYIPKQISKSGLKLDLITTKWEAQSYIKIGDAEVPNKYIANCTYATKQRVNNPNTYKIIAEYNGTATKIEENPTIYKIQYEIVKDAEEKNNNIVPIVGGTTGIILIIIFFITGNVTVYNYQEGQWKKVGKTRMYNNKITLNRFILFEKTNKYKLKLSKGLANKKKGKLITVSKNGNSIRLLVNSERNMPYTFETRL